MVSDANTVMLVKGGGEEEGGREKKITTSLSNLHSFIYPLLGCCNLAAFTLWKLLSL